LIDFIFKGDEVPQAESNTEVKTDNDNKTSGANEVKSPVDKAYIVPLSSPRMPTLGQGNKGPKVCLYLLSL
jgi:hypothetical protein